jgi:hypothetical protein
MSARRRELVPNKPIGECLLGGANSVSKQETASFEGGNLAWEASTLPLSYTRPNHIYFSPKNHACKGGVLASPTNSTKPTVDLPTQDENTTWHTTICLFNTHLGQATM